MQHDSDKSAPRHADSVVNLRLQSRAERNLEGWIQYIQMLHYRTMDLALDRSRTVINRICPGSVPFKVVSVAGTNGKGSVATMLESIFRHAGYSTGLYTSPHLVRFNERFVVSGQTISDAALLEEFERVEEKRGNVPLTFFEYGTAIAIDYFIRRKVDVAVLEVGLGGRKDAVNVMDADFACITSIGTDHVKWLGETREKVGYEKAGILRTNQLSVCTDTTVTESIRNAASELSLKLYVNGDDFVYDDGGSVWTWKMNAVQEQIAIHSIPKPAISGACQRGNAAGAVSISVLARKYFQISDDAIRAGIKAASLNGRLQIIQEEPTVLLDVAHNIESVRELRDYLQANPVKGRNIALMSVLSEKPIELMVDCVKPMFDEWYLCGIQDERGIPVRKLFRRVSPVLGDDVRVELHYDAGAAFGAAMESVNKLDRIVVFGSFLTVGAIIEKYQKILPN